ncbi:MAG: CotH kinase family protein [Bacteroidales bacterium]|nr:CotH kinase family protein [Bacteroidales bacterium]
MNKNFLFILIFFSFILIKGHTQSHWESIVLSDDLMKYYEAVATEPSNWQSLLFDDSAWKIGPGGFGYGDDDDVTFVGHVNSLYLRIEFTINDIAILNNILLDIDYDDAFVAYLNETEVARSANITEQNPAYNSPLTTDHEARMYTGGQPERFKISTDFLVNGENLLAIQVLNTDTNSSDLSAIVFMNAEINSPDIIYNQVPSWFIAPASFTSLNLPIIAINTFGQYISYDNNINAHMGIVSNETGINSINDPFNGYDGFISIRGRGSSSQMFAKKNYNIETQTETGENNNVSLLGLPEENDWVLHGPYSDKTLIRNALIYHLGTLMGKWAPRSRFCELYLNNEYCGVYVLLEKIKRDKNRLNIPEILPEFTSGDEMTGGYILKIDRPDPGSWTSPFKGINGINNIEISYVEPEWETMPAIQRNYIKDFVTNFEYALHDEPFDDKVKGYRAYINVPSFVDYYIINEFTKNVDGYRLSSFFFKDRDSRGGKLCMGPLWDYNLAFGNADYYDCGNTEGWLVNSIPSGDGFQIPFWWEKLREDPLFNSDLKKRWFSLREGPFSQAKIYATIDSLVNIIEEAQIRNFTQFPVLSEYIWPNNFIGNNYEAEINYLKYWINDRLAWMDNQLEPIIEIDGIQENYTNNYEINIYPNPFENTFTLNIYLYESADIIINIYNLTGQIIYSYNNTFPQGLNEIPVNLSKMGKHSGMLLFQIKLNNQLIKSDKIIKK